MNFFRTTDTTDTTDTTIWKPGLNKAWLNFAVMAAMLVVRPCTVLDDIREFKKLRRQLQGKRHIKIELCVKFSLLRLFHVDHVVQNRRSALPLAWHEWFSYKGK